MSRLLLVFAAMAVMAAMLAVMAAPAFAQVVVDPGRRVFLTGELGDQLQSNGAEGKSPALSTNIPGDTVIRIDQAPFGPPNPQ